MILQTGSVRMKENGILWEARVHQREATIVESLLPTSLTLNTCLSAQILIGISPVLNL